jgi:hypothetical protein
MDKDEQKKIIIEGMKKRFQSADEMKTALESFSVPGSEKKSRFKNIFG